MSVWLLVGDSVVVISAWGFSGWIQLGSLGWNLGERRLWRLNYSRMKKSAMVNVNNYLS